ncbi:MAG: DEAD/DEAH box helicase family protein [Opitutaceae bacterium]|nr:DEAD/DEAH box helicase family protein [Opitutaceae bacterium]
MLFDLAQRTASLSVGEFAGFTLGPHDSGSGPQGIWRAQLGTYWHNELRSRTAAENSAATFEVTIAGQVFHQGWTLTLTGRIDQLLPPPSTCNALSDKLSEKPAIQIVTLREIKTVLRPLPVDEAELRAAYPEYFAQLAAYLVLSRIADPVKKLRAELLFLEAGSGLAQSISLTPADELSFRTQLDRVVEFLNLRWRARERLKHLGFRPAFSALRPGQEQTRANLTAAFEQNPAVLFEAPTGFGKTGVLLEFALGQLQSGHFERVLYVTSKSTGQLQVVRQLGAMTAAETTADATSTPLAVWHVRNKSEHCVNHTFHCVRDSCAYLDGIESRWAQSGLARFYRLENQARDLETLRTAGREARICPYEITRTALAFNDVWIGDYNYVFAPANRTLFYNQPGFDPARTLLIIDEAHNLPSRVADAYSHVVKSGEARALLAELDHVQAPATFVRAWESFVQLLAALLPVDALDPALEADLAHTLATLVAQLASQPLDYAALGSDFSDQLWRTQQLSEWLNHPQLTKLLWCPREGELCFTCIDAASAIGETLRSYGGVVLASATLSPAAEFTENIGLADFGLGKPDTGNTTAGRARPPGAPRTTGDESSAIGGPGGPALPSELSGLSNPTSGIAWVSATTPWRDGAYEVAVDARVDTRFQQRASYYAMTAATIAALQAAARRPVAVFFPSYAYADSVARELERAAPLKVALQPRLHDLAAQTAWIEESLAFTDALFLVLGSSFAESIDLLGGRVSHAMVVGPALPEVNAVQRARLAEFSPLGREAAFRRVYQIPGMQKVNQALGRLVRAPGQKARVLLHCRRFAEVSYASLLATDYQFGVNITTDAELAEWLGRT